jgi:hypothetical protein
MIELTPELERRLEREAARHGQKPQEFARTVLEERLTGLTASASPDLESLFADLPRRTPEEVQAFLRAQGATPVERFEDLLGDFWPAGESVDEFLEARRRWQREGSPGFPWDQPDPVVKRTRDQ